MKLDACRVVLRPRSMTEIFDLGLRFATAPAAKLYAKLGLLTLIPAWALCVAAHYALGWAWGPVWLLALGLATPIQGVYTVAIGRMMFAEQVGVGEVLGAFVRRLPAYLATLLATRVLLAIASTLSFAIVPPFWMWARCAYVHEACLLEQADPTEAIRRAARMVAGNIASAAGLLLLMSLAAAGFVFVAEALLNLGLLEFVLQLGMPFGSLFDLGGSVPALLGLFLAVPYWATVRFLSYVDLRTRRDGWDIQLRFMALKAEAEAVQEVAA